MRGKGTWFMETIGGTTFPPVCLTEKDVEDYRQRMAKFPHKHILTPLVVLTQEEYDKAIAEAEERGRNENQLAGSTQSPVAV